MSLNNYVEVEGKGQTNKRDFHKPRQNYYKKNQLSQIGKKRGLACFLNFSREGS